MRDFVDGMFFLLLQLPIFIEGVFFKETLDLSATVEEILISISFILFFGLLQ